MTKGLIREGLLNGADEFFLSMDKYEIYLNLWISVNSFQVSVVLNSIVGGLLEKGEIKSAVQFFCPNWMK